MLQCSDFDHYIQLKWSQSCPFFFFLILTEALFKIVWIFSTGGYEHAFLTPLQVTTLTALYCVTILLSLTGNVLLIFIVTRKSEARTLTAFLFVNMAVADLLVTLIVMPVSVKWLYTDGIHRWLPGILGHVTCTLVYYSSYVTLAASIFSLSIMSVDRYLGVVYPLRRFPKFRQAKVLSATIWLSSIIFSIPVAVTWRLEEFKKLNLCTPNFLILGKFGMRGFYMYLFLVMYLTPLLLMSSLYVLVGRTLWLRNLPGRQLSNQGQQRNEMTKRKVVRTLVIITAIFGICWLPTQFYHLVLAFDKDVHDKIPTYVVILVLWLAHANSAVNPWLYMILSENFRKALCDVVHRNKHSRYRSRSTRAQSSTRYTSFTSPCQNNSARQGSRKQRNDLLNEEQEELCRVTVLWNPDESQNHWTLTVYMSQRMECNIWRFPHTPSNVQRWG